MVSERERNREKEGKREKEEGKGNKCRNWYGNPSCFSIEVILNFSLFDLEFSSILSLIIEHHVYHD